MKSFRMKNPEKTQEIATMSENHQTTSRNPKSILTSIMLTLVLVFAATPTVFADDVTVELFENLVPVKDAQMGMAYIDPNADFSVFKRVMILEPFVAFRSNWQRDQNRGSRRNRVSNRDMERIKSDTANLFRDVFIEQLQADGGFEIVEEGGDDVLLIRPAIIDLDITAPDVMTSGRNRTFTASAGAATLYIELFDSVSGQIIGRAADRQAVRSSGGRVTWSNRVTNSAEARRIFRGWADTLRTFLDQHYSSK